MDAITLSRVSFDIVPYDINLKAIQLAWRRNCLKMPISNTAPKIINERQIAAYDRISCSYLGLLKQNPNGLTDQEFLEFIKLNFELYHVITADKIEGLMTGYYQPELYVSPYKTSEYIYPIYARPKDLIIIEDAGILNPSVKGIRIAGRLENGTVVPYLSHAEIITHGLENQATVLAWTDNYIDLFFAHIQGSARLIYQNGSEQHISYDGTNGHRYTPIGRYMIEKNYLNPNYVSMQTIKQWLYDNPKLQQSVLTQNKSYIFFKHTVDPAGPLGYFKTVLTPEASIAIDPYFVPLGCMMWLDADHPTANNQRLQRFVMAQDIGGVIKGPLRADFYWGAGAQAALNAGQMKSKTKFYILLPHSNRV